MRGILLTAVASAALTTPAAAEEFGGFPPGRGQAEAFATCTACHSTAIVRQQRQTREGWDEIITWMQDEKGMWQLEPPMRELILNYLAEHYNPDVPR